MSEDVLAIAQRHLHKVKRSGPENIMALCPFHDNTDTPAFTMSLTTGLYYCFSCQERGNLLTFLKNLGVTRVIIERQYRGLIDDLKKNAPRKADPLRPDSGKFQNAEVPEHLLGLFDQCPLALLEDGFEEELLQKLDIGFDEQHMRITYPLRKLDGTLVGISGRTVNGDRPKYKVYDREFKDWDLPLHKTYKSHLLWNGHLVYPEVYFSRKPVIAVEGYKACMRMLQAGATNTVAIMGNEVSEQQKWQLERLGSEVWLFLDNNEAGFLGTVRAGMKIGLPVKLLMYPDDREQPSDLSPEEIKQAIDCRKDFHRWLLDTPAAMDEYRTQRRKQEAWKNKEQQYDD